MPQAEELYELVDQYFADYRRLVQGIAALVQWAFQSLAGVWKPCCRNARKVQLRGLEETTPSDGTEAADCDRWPPGRPRRGRCEEEGEGKRGALLWFVSCRAKAWRAVSGRVPKF